MPLNGLDFLEESNITTPAIEIPGTASKTGHNASSSRVTPEPKRLGIVSPLKIKHGSILGSQANTIIRGKY